jgi:protein ImuB
MTSPDIAPNRRSSASRGRAPQAPLPQSPSHHPIGFSDRPLWLLPEPKPLELAALTASLSGPERIESGWWDGQDAQRDYYIVRTSGGTELWVYRDLAQDGAWYLHGFWS